MLYLIQDQYNEKFIITYFPNKETLAKYIKDNPSISHEDYVIMQGELQHHKGRHIYDGRFK
jgi:hypothetical protein